MVFHAESLPRMNALIEKLESGQVMGLEEYIRNTPDGEMTKFYGEMPKGRGRKEKQQERSGRDAERYEIKGFHKRMGREETNRMDGDSYLKMKDIEAIPLDQR